MATYEIGGRAFKKNRPGLKLPGTRTAGGKYVAEWINVLDATVSHSKQFDHSGGERSIAAPKCQDDVPPGIVRQE